MGVAIIVEMRRATSTTLVRLPLLLGLLAVFALLSNATRAASVPDLYAADVPATGAGQAGLDAAFNLALKEVLVKLTGQRNVPAEVAAALGPAAPLVQRYQPLGAGRIRVQFDGPALRQRLDGTALPYWGDDRPRVLVVLVQPSVEPATQSMVLGAAARRGIPAVLADPAAVTAADPLAAAQAEARRAGADVVLIGRASPSAGVAAYRWSLALDGEQAEWQGDAAEGPEGAADRLAARYAAAATVNQPLRLVVEGITGFDAYGQVLAHLRAQNLVQSLQVREAAGDRVVFDLTVRGSPQQFRAALAERAMLAPDALAAPLPGATEPLAAGGLPASPAAVAELRYRVAGVP